MILRRLTMAVLVTAASMVVATPARAATPVRIMPLGASITWGTSSSDGNGYREHLRRHLVDAGLAIDFVGSQQSGTMTDRDNEGHPGYRIDQIAAGADAWLAAAQPDVVLLNVGTNDTLQNRDLPNAPGRLRDLLDQIVAARPTATVLFSTLVPSGNATNDARVREFNAQLPAIAQAQAQAGHHVRLVDLNTTLTAADIGSDTIHPTDGGYAKLASLWHTGLRPVLGAGRDWPLFRTDFGDAAPPLTWTDSVVASVNVGGFCCGLTAMQSGRRAETAHGGTYALMFSGNDLSATQSYSYNRVFDVHVPIAADTTLTYWIYPQYPATSVALDLSLSDGRSLRDSGATDQHGVRAHPAFQGQGGRLVVNQWNLVRVPLSALAGGTIDQIRIGYDQPATTGIFRGYVDDIAIVSG
ncbi:SGNH/GDSL hydrolase family protein [Catenuloplanes japonicus]|uniref:SGNH/GDSL hydrolase family protein n=1 Tax=Catenuloplanes japonicus TaxID=33876 RepID=UPI000A0FB2F5|nr:SGNH/GDSL hydrolase family protein [Catenuloplanes japonicus]